MHGGIIGDIAIVEREPIVLPSEMRFTDMIGYSLGVAELHTQITKTITHSDNFAAMTGAVLLTSSGGAARAIREYEHLPSTQAYDCRYGAAIARGIWGYVNKTDSEPDVEATATVLKNSWLALRDHRVFSRALGRLAGSGLSEQVKLARKNNDGTVIGQIAVRTGELMRHERHARNTL